MKTPLVIAHRGASASAPENTLAAFRKALEAGADMIELDVRFSLDRHPVVIHDHTLGRTTDGTGEVAALPLRRLRSLDAGSWFSPSFSGEAIPTLREVCRLVAPTGAGMLIEIKAERGLPPDFAELLLAVVDQESMRTRSILQSFDHRAVRRLREIDPGLGLALLFDSAERDPALFASAAGVGMVALHWRLFNRRIAAEAARLGLGVLVWTVNRERDMQRMMSLGVDGIITNHPDRALRRRAGADMTATPGHGTTRPAPAGSERGNHRDDFYSN